MTLTVELPVPPSANALFVARRGRRYASAKYRKWRHEAGWLLAGTQPLPQGEPYRVVIEAAVNRRRDIDNLVKPVLDLLVAHAITPDDRHCDAVEARRVDPSFGLALGWLRVTVTGAADRQARIRSAVPGWAFYESTRGDAK